MRRLWPDTLFGRLALLLLSFALVSHVLALTAMFELQPHPPGPPSPPQVLEPPPAPGGPYAMPGPMPPSVMNLGPLLDIGVRLTALTVAAWIAALWLSRPIKHLALAAQEIGRNVGFGPQRAEPLVEEGPAECREAARVFNDMQSQIRRHLDERHRFVAAVSHDLRTPLTRLRLRAEGLAEPAQRARFCQDIQEMDRMISATLDYLRGAAAAEAFEPLDVQALVDSLAEDQQAMGHDVQVIAQASGPVGPITARPSALRRCIGNLVDNAVRYGGAAEIRLGTVDNQLRITVRDPGPGIAEHQLEQVLEPFYRVEGSRNRQHGGVGLGLSIARDIAVQHQGSLALANAAEGGLVATLLLPR
jgi:protein-histidine pros-kinase